MGSWPELDLGTGHWVWIICRDRQRHFSGTSDSKQLRDPSRTISIMEDAREHAGTFAYQYCLSFFLALLLSFPVRVC